MMKYKIPAGTTVNRYNSNTHGSEDLVTTKDAFYDDSDRRVPDDADHMRFFVPIKGHHGWREFHVAKIDVLCKTDGYEQLPDLKSSHHR